MAKSPGGNVTRTDVARVAGTSVAVVSYVINNGPRPVAEATRQRVLAAIKQTGYRPNAVARALASGTTKTFGLIVPNIANPFVASMAHVLLQESLNHGHIMLLGDAGDDRQRELELIQGMLNRQIDGLFYNSVDRHPYIDVVQASGTPLLMLDRITPRPGVSVLSMNERLAACDVTRHLLSHGYQQVGMISGPPAMFNARDRIQGWRDAMQERGLPVDESLIFPADYSRQGGYDAAQRMIASGRVPRALFASNEGQAIGCIRAFAEQGIRVPQDVALVCFNGTTQAVFHVPSLTTVRQPLSELAQRAIAMLKNQPEEGVMAELPHYIETGESCGCLQP
ncbi:MULTISPECIES: LacI family DNA-binding transcriptional regulator [Pantoea]|uniref:LacI family DNA-binding transcriptional regulator n=1 Tax=Pantoea eucrina TaxID=472693 RepID=A0ABS1Z6J2_9GAMM|nr:MULTISPECIES: LacI family DNA-binding transcriptional regulator [Pantoea]AIX52133.1 transcriptional regulator [Pantoea sp. PSNIH1]MBM0748045.1 LacI family DNA-binding transcriptional regulator [Pantoea eucrina]MDJ0022726.1 LacI family DNA-binding transcriptional regulator [Pantoea eucrina]OIX91901.1 transcriptional regulator [Pantoea sp. Ae16]UBB13669.1 LacI family transcriptional regulator [Pantoea eucrina]